MGMPSSLIVGSKPCVFIAATVVAVCLVISGAAADDQSLRSVTSKLFNATRAQPIDLSSQDLSGFDLSKTDFKAARLQQANLFGADLTDADLSAT